MSRVGIERLPPKRASNEPRESMNCKSCRKRKIKCNRVKPTCEACALFQATCIYDAVPKKRGPKTDVLESLLKRVDGIERKLQDDNRSGHPLGGAGGEPSNGMQPPGSGITAPAAQYENGMKDQIPLPMSSASDDFVLDTFFARLHGKPFYILDEISTRQAYRSGRISVPLLFAIRSVANRYIPGADTSNPNQAILENAERAKASLNVEDPSLDNLQIILLLCLGYYAVGKGRRVHMLLSSAMGMALGLELHREAPPEARLGQLERETRRRLFWTCYLMDRVMTCGSKRPSLISDRSIILRLPSPAVHPSIPLAEGEFFQNGPDPSNNASGHALRKPGRTALLVEIAQILGTTNEYLAAGGVKGDSHFPWHSLSTISKVRSRLNDWATKAQDLFGSIESFVEGHEGTTAVLSRLIYHAIHCLIFRAFLPIDIAELSNGGQHQSWQIEATKICFNHANAIAELVEAVRRSSGIEWPSFAGYCVCVAATVHVHGSYYKGPEAEPFSRCSTFLAQEMRHLTQIFSWWAGLHHQQELLQTVYTAHADLVRSLESGSSQHAPVLNLEGFFDRYPGKYLDGSFNSLTDDPFSGFNASVTPYAPLQTNITPGQPQPSITTAPSYTPTLNQHLPPTFKGEGPVINGAPMSPPLPSPAFSSTYLPQQPSQSPGLQQQQIPGQEQSISPVSPQHDQEHDPFLNLLEQIANNEHSRTGPSELDFFLSETQ